jgi:hypothetical protein
MSMVLGIMERVEERLKKTLIDDIAPNDPTRAGAIKIGPFQGDPAPDVGRITISIHENDPDRIAKGAVTGMNEDLSDSLDDVEIGGAVTTTRRFTIKGRCLFSDTREPEDEARRIAETVRQRVERTLKSTSFNGVVSDSEYVARGVLSNELRVEMIQAGGPSDSFDFLFKVQFSVLTTQTGVFS